MLAVCSCAGVNEENLFTVHDLLSGARQSLGIKNADCRLQLYYEIDLVPGTFGDD